LSVAVTKIKKEKVKGKSPRVIKEGYTCKEEIDIFKNSIRTWFKRFCRKEDCKC